MRVFFHFIIFLFGSPFNVKSIGEIEQNAWQYCFLCHTRIMYKMERCHMGFWEGNQKYFIFSY